MTSDDDRDDPNPRAQCDNVYFGSGRRCILPAGHEGLHDDGPPPRPYKSAREQVIEAVCEQVRQAERHGKHVTAEEIAQFAAEYARRMGVGK